MHELALIHCCERQQLEAPVLINLNFAFAFQICWQLSCIVLSRDGSAMHV